LIEEFHTWSARPQLHLEYAERARLLGDTATALHHRREAHQQFTAMGATGHAARLAKELEGEDH
jgi:hypothetical protein